MASALIIAITIAGKVIACVLYSAIRAFKVVIEYKVVIAYKFAVSTQYKYRCIKVKRLAGVAAVSIPPKAYGKFWGCYTLPLPLF